MANRGGASTLSRFTTKYLRNRSPYCSRIPVEAVFVAIKKKLGETISSRDPVAQVNELLCKVLAYNITVLIHEAFEHGILLPGSESPQPEPEEPDLAGHGLAGSATADAWTPRSAPAWEDN